MFYYKAYTRKATVNYNPLINTSSSFIWKAIFWAPQLVGSPNSFSSSTYSEAEQSVIGGTGFLQAKRPFRDPTNSVKELKKTCSTDCNHRTPSTGLILSQPTAKWKEYCSLYANYPTLAS